MNLVADAIKYVLEVTGLSSKDLKVLVENTDSTYDGDDENKWYAAQLVGIAQSLGQGKTLLLAKWTEHIIDIEEKVLATIEDSYGVMSNAISIDMRNTLLDIIGEEACTSLAGYRELLSKYADTCVEYEGDWTKVVDYDDYNAYMSREGGEAFADMVSSSPEQLVFLESLSDRGTFPKTSPLYTEARREGVTLTNHGQALLYALVAFSRAHSMISVRALLRSNAEFWSNPLNKPVIKLFSEHFGLTERSFWVNSREFNSANIRGGIDVLIEADDSVEGLSTITLGGVTSEDDTLVFGNWLDDGSTALDGLTVAKDVTEGRVNTFGITADGTLTPDKSAKGVKGALGYVTINGIVSVENYPRVGADNYAITVDNIEDMAVLYGLLKATEGNLSYASGLPIILTGKPGYQALVANTLPILLYGRSSGLRDWGVVSIGGEPKRLRNKLEYDSDTVSSLHEEYWAHMDFEARKLWEFGKEIGEDEGKSLRDYESVALEDDPEFLSDWETHDKDLLNHLVSNYTKFLGW